MKTTDLEAAAQQALEALENLQPIIGNGLLNKIQLAFIDPNLDVAITALRAALAQQDEPVATVTECEACFTPDVCQLRGTCDYYTASQMRIAAPPRCPNCASLEAQNTELDQKLAELERAHGIKE